LSDVVPVGLVSSRSRQLNYSEIQSLMLDSESRRAKASKILAILEHFLGRKLGSDRVVDVGCSAGLILASVTSDGGSATGVDIDEPGLAKAREQFPETSFVRADSEQLPFRPRSVDVLLCNQVYEHVVSSERLFDEIKRVLAPSGVAYLGLGNRRRLVEPHYGLPFLSWLPNSLADRYVRLTHRGTGYHERFRTRSGLLELCSGLNVWDYTMSVLAEPERFCATDVVPGPLSRVPIAAWRAFEPVMPTFLWIASTSDRGPQGEPLLEPPRLITTG
jgi:SAM-dependent methyltransferase